jgi:hypothetical protein
VVTVGALESDEEALGPTAFVAVTVKVGDVEEPKPVTDIGDDAPSWYCPELAVTL